MPSHTYLNLKQNLHQNWKTSTETNKGSAIYTQTVELNFTCMPKGENHDKKNKKKTTSSPLPEATSTLILAFHPIVPIVEHALCNSNAHKAQHVSRTTSRNHYGSNFMHTHTHKHIYTHAYHFINVSSSIQPYYYDSIARFSYIYVNLVIFPAKFEF